MSNIESMFIMLFALLSILFLLSLFLILWRFKKHKEQILLPEDNTPTPTFLQEDDDTTDTRQQLKDRILNALVNQKIYLDKDLTLNKLARDVNSNRHYVSQVINQEFHMNFYHLINNHRIKEFESLLVSVGNFEKVNIKELSEQAGFKSFSSFNSYFKEIKGTTPGEYRKSLRMPSLFQDENI